MTGHLYRYCHPRDFTRFIYVGQGAKRDGRHRSGKSSFGRRFKKLFPGAELPQPTREKIEIENHLELNELETIWMFQYHTWHGYKGGMNLTLPGSDDYKNIGRLGSREAKAKGGRNGSHESKVRGGRNGNRESKAKGGKLVGLKNVENKTGFFARSSEKHSEDSRKGGRIGARKRNKLYGSPATPEGRAKGGRKNVESGHISALGKAQGRKNAKNSQIQILGHLRWHVLRNKPNSKCKFCIQENKIV